MDIQNNENKATCTKCGGRCCKSLGGFFHPNDIGVDNITKDDLINFIKRGDVSIDWLEGDDDNLYFLRMRNQRANIIDPSWGGVYVVIGPRMVVIYHLKNDHMDAKDLSRIHLEIVLKGAMINTNVVMIGFRIMTSYRKSRVISSTEQIQNCLCFTDRSG